MTTHGVDVRTPIFYRHSFANVLEAQSGKVYARFTHTPLIAEHLPHGAVSGALIEQYAATHLHTLVDLEKLLRAVLDETFGAHASLHHPAASMREGGSDELNATILSPSSAILPGSSAPAEDGMGGEEAATVGSTPRGADADARQIHPAHPRGCGGFAVEQEACTSPRKLPLPVSFPADPPSVAPSFEAANSDRQKASVAAGASVHGAASHLWERLRGWARRTDSAAAAPLPRSTSNISLSAAAANSNVARTRRTRVPQWVRAPFAPTPGLAALRVSTSVSAAPAMRWMRSPAPVLSVSPSESAAASQRAETHHTTSPDAVVITQSSQLRNTADMHDNDDAGGGRARQGDDGDASSSHLTQTPRRYTHGPSPAERDPASMSLDIQVTPGQLTPTASHTNVHEKGGALTADARRTHPVVSPSKMVFMAATAAGERAGDGINVPAAPSRATAQLGAGHDTRQNGSDVSGEQLSEDRLLPRPRHGGSSGASGGAAGASTDLRSAGPSLSFSHTWHTGDVQAPSIPPTTTRIPQRRTSAASCWDRRAYATELVGWLHLLVWVRWQVIHFLRDLSGVQGFVAWSAWYWSWAQEHPRQAAFHQALSSASFWRGMWSHGLHAQLNQVHYEISRHMFTLQSVFQLIVSYIGAVYTALEQLNTLVVQVQRSCEVMMSPVAAAAAVAVARAPVATAGSGRATSPLPTNYANAHLGGGALGCDSKANQNSMLWSPIAAGVGGGRASSLTQGSRGRAGSQQRRGQSAFASAAASVTPHARRGLHDEAERESEISFFEEEMEAASSLHAMDELRRAVWSMLQQLKTMFCPDGLPLDVLEVNDQVRFPWSGGGGGLSAAGPATASIARPDSQAALHRSDENALLGMSVLDEAVPAAQSSGYQVHFAEAGTSCAHNGSGLDGGQPPSVREGARVLLQCVQCSQVLLRRLTVLVQRAHSPPTARHWRRILVAAFTIVPPFMWVYTKSPTELVAIARKTVIVGRQVLWSYVIDPVMQLRESLSYVRPGVEDRRGAVERDAVSLANIIRDFHEDMYPSMPQKRLEELRDRTFKRLQAGVADPEGLGLIDEQYRHSVRHPIRSVLFGHLPRIMLIQLSYQALEVSRVANGIDEVLEGNDINFKIMAMMPVFLAGGLLATWGLFRYRFKYKPVRLRMKLLWRSLFRVISFAGNGEGLVLPFLRITAQQPGIRPHAEATALVVDFPRAQTNLAGATGRLRSTKARRHAHSSAAAVGATLDSSLPSRNTERGGSRRMDDIDTAAFSESGRDSESSSDESRSASGSAVTARQLNNYEQGMVLLLSHVMRSIAAEHLRSYAFFHELMEDLNDLESVQSTRRQRLATLTRMRATHTYFF
ncbi:ATP synthase regulation protein NCA2 [Leishmania donovani]|nr:ATP synthase regulation protein NCA2 [Leishmania donovani]